MKKALTILALMYLVSFVAGCVTFKKESTPPVVSQPFLSASTHLNTLQFQSFVYDEATNVSERAWLVAAGTVTNPLPNHLNDRQMQSYARDGDTNVVRRVVIINFTNLNASLQAQIGSNTADVVLLYASNLVVVARIGTNEGLLLANGPQTAGGDLDMTTNSVIFAGTSSNLVSNGDFATDFTSDYTWTNVLLTWAWSANNAFHVGGPPDEWLMQDVGAISGHTYRVIYSIVQSGSGGIIVQIGGSATNGLEEAADGTYTNILTAINTSNLQFMSISSGGGNNVALDNVSAVDITATSGVAYAEVEQWKAVVDQGWHNVPTNWLVTISNYIAFLNGSLEVYTNIDMQSHSISNIASNSLHFVGGTRVGLDGSNIVFISADGKTNILDGLDKTDKTALESLITANGTLITANATDIGRNENNILGNALRISVNSDLVLYGLDDGFVDAYEDESGIDIGISSNQIYASGADTYSWLYNMWDTSNSIVAQFKCNDDAANSNVLDSTGDNNSWLVDTEVAINTDTISTNPGRILKGFYLVRDTEHNGDYIHSATNFQEVIRGSHTIMGWFKPTDGQAAQASKLWGIRDNDFLHLQLSSDGTIYHSFSVNGTGFNFSSSAAVFPNGQTDWTHIAGIYNTNTDLYLFYADGAFITMADSNYPLSSQHFEGEAGFWAFGAFGFDTAAYAPLDGAVDDCRVYNTNLTVLQLLGIVNSGAGTEELSAVTGGNMLLQSTNIPMYADTEPTAIRIEVLIEDADSDLTINTDVQAWASRDAGTNWAQVMLSNSWDFSSTIVAYSGITTNLAGSGTNIMYKIPTYNLKDGTIHGTAIMWK